MEERFARSYQDGDMCALGKAPEEDRRKRTCSYTQELIHARARTRKSAYTQELIHARKENASVYNFDTCVYLAAHDPQNGID